jgi:hypothetical protein
LAYGRSVILPDDKDWTWVLDRPCPDCGFDASTCPAPDVFGLIRENVRAWRRLFADGSIRPGRPDDATWSPLEYACHVRDVYRRYETRIALMLAEDDPPFANWDQDASAAEDRYEDQDPAHVMADLEAAAESLSARLEQVGGSQWDRHGRRSDGATFTIATIPRYMIHDPIHHLWDVSKQQS